MLQLEGSALQHSRVLRVLNDEDDSRDKKTENDGIRHAQSCSQDDVRDKHWQARPTRAREERVHGQLYLGTIDSDYGSVGTTRQDSDCCIPAKSNHGSLRHALINSSTKKEKATWHKRAANIGLGIRAI